MCAAENHRQTYASRVLRKEGKVVGIPFDFGESEARQLPSIPRKPRVIMVLERRGTWKNWKIKKASSTSGSLKGNRGRMEFEGQIGQEATNPQ